MSTRLTTRIKLKDSVTKQDFQNLCIEWIRGSKRYPRELIPENIAEIINEPHNEISLGKYSVHFRNYHTKDGEYDFFAFRLKLKDHNEIQWCTDAVYSDEKGEKSVLIQVNPTATHYEKVPLPKVPYLVTLLIRKEYCADDGGLPVNGKPLEVSMSDIDMCAKIMNAKSDNILPVVYISKDYWGTTVDPVKLAADLKGVAHVLVEKDLNMKGKLKKKTNGRNAFGSYIGIYFPKTKYYRKFSVFDYGKDEERLLNDLKPWLFTQFSGGEIHNIYTWSHIAYLQENAFGAESQEELNAFLDNFDSPDVKELRDQNSRLKEYASRLEHTNDALQQSLNDKNKGKEDTKVLDPGVEKEKYPGEFTDLMIYILRQVKSRYHENSRPAHIIDSILDANELTGKNEKIMHAFKSAVSDGQKLSNKDKQILKSVGFPLEQNTHLKCAYCDDDRYIIMISTTPSDSYHGGKNNYSEITNLLDLNKKI